MNPRWEFKELGLICTNLDSQRKPITKRNRIGGEIPYYGATGIVDYVNDYIFNEKLVLLGEDGAKWNCGDECTFIIDGKTWVNNHAHVLRPNRQVVLDEWLVYFLNYQDLTPFVSGMTVPKLNQGKMNEIVVPTPPLHEQHRIVSILDEAFASITKARANAEQNLKNARVLFESYLHGVFTNDQGWRLQKLGEICKITDGTHFSPKNSREGDYMYITAKNIKPYNIDISNITFVSEHDHEEIFARCSPRKGDVLYIKDGATAGIAAINNIEEEFSMLSSVALIKCSDAILNTFLVHYLNSDIGKKNFLGHVDGAAITRLTLVKIKNVIVSFPSQNKQQIIVSRIDKLHAEIRKLESIYQQKLHDLEELKKSILQRAFNGELKTT